MPNNVAVDYQEPIKFELDTAHTDTEQGVRGAHQLEVDDVSDSTIEVYVDLHLENGQRIKDLKFKQSGKYVSPVPISKIRFSAPATAGGWIKLKFANLQNPPERAEYDSGEQPAINSIGSIDTAVKIAQPSIATPKTKVTVGDTPTLVLAANPNRKSATFYNSHGANTVADLGTDSMGLFANGMPVDPKSRVTTDVTGAIYMRCDTGLSADVLVREEV